ncbi:MAG: ABC transporter permease [Oscillospiraceae bacterium]|nr:ABC transporter permease [Oscillospiraceae bacterium]
MNLVDSIRSSLTSIFHNRMRSFLTMLGIIIGISSVILVVALGSGSTDQISGQFNKMGAKTLNISVNMEDSVISDLLIYSDIKSIEDSDVDIYSATPQDQVDGTVEIENKGKRGAYLYFVNNEFPNIGGIDLLGGRFFNKSDYEDAKQYVVIDSLTCEKLFKTKEVIGRSLKVNYGGIGRNLHIIGVFDIDPFFAGVGTDIADVVGVPAFAFIPYTLEQYFGMNTKNLFRISAVLKNDTRINEVADNIFKVLAIKHNNLGRKVYKIERASTQINKYGSIINIVSLLVVCVAGISLVVGGIGVMNIMLVSVTERTREIGTRKALGASTFDIMTQFLIEAVLICLLGGIVGVFLGISLATLISRLTGLKSIQNINVILLALGSSSLVGIFFGIYPARKAAQLNPIDALRKD